MQKRNGELKSHIKMSRHNFKKQRGFIDMRSAHGFALEIEGKLSSNHRPRGKS
jgi:hypothetical protein